MLPQVMKCRTLSSIGSSAYTCSSSCSSGNVANEHLRYNGQCIQPDSIQKYRNQDLLLLKEQEVYANIPLTD